MTRYAPYIAIAGIIVTITGIALLSPAVALIAIGATATASALFWDSK